MSEAGRRRGVCLVIGAGDGLGASIARAFAREGLCVCVTRRPRHNEAIDNLAETIRADRQQLKNDITNGADKCVVGQDVLNAHADKAKLRAAADAVRDQILAKLSTDQQATLKDCLQTSRGVRGPGPAGLQGRP